MKPFIIGCDVYPFDILVKSGTNLKDIKEYFTKEEFKALKKLELKSALTIMLPSGKTLIWLRNKPKKIDDMSILAHEIFHCACFILEKVGCKLNKYTEEPYAYLIQHITKKIYKELGITISF